MSSPAVVVKTPTVAVIEQVGALIVTVVGAVMTQHLYATLMREPASSWLNKALGWWERRQEARQVAQVRRLQRVYSQEGAPEPPASSE